MEQVDGTPQQGTKDQQIISSIRSGKYAYSTSNGSFPKCNIFSDDMLKQHWGVNIPRLYEADVFESDEFRERRKNYPKIYTGLAQSEKNPNHADKPISAWDSENYFKGRSKIQDSGVESVDIKDVTKIDTEKTPVIFVGEGHFGLVSDKKD